MALPYTLDLPHLSRAGTTTNIFRGTIPADRLASSDQDRQVDLTIVYVPSIDLSSFDLDIGGGTSRYDLTDELEGARLKLQNADGTTTFWQSVLEDEDMSDTYSVELEADDAQALQAYTGTLRLRFETPADPVDVTPGAVQLPAPSATAEVQPRGGSVAVTPGAVSLPAPSARAAVEIVNNPRDVVPGNVRLPAPTASASASVVGPVSVRPGAVSLPAPSASLSVDTYSLGEEYDIAIRASAPEAMVLTCVEITHPSQSDPIRLVDDAEPLTVDGATYAAARFESRFMEDGDRGAPRGFLVIGNIGREVSRWIDEAEGGVGGEVRAFEVVLVEGQAHVEWELTMDISSVTTEDTIQIGLGFAPLLGRPAVAMRYDPQTAPGLF